MPQNNAEAQKWHRLAADQGDSGAQFVPGLMYKSNWDYVPAHVLFNLSAAQGRPNFCKGAR